MTTSSGAVNCCWPTVRLSAPGNPEPDDAARRRAGHSRAWRLLYSLLLQNHGIEELQQLAVFAAEPAAKLANLGKLASSGIGPKSHSIGRLFDAAAALLANLRLSQYEGQAGIILETLARRAIAAGKQQSAEKLGLELKLEHELEPTSTRAELVLGQWQSAPLFSALLLAWRTEPDSELLALAFIQAIGKGLSPRRSKP